MNVGKVCLALALVCSLAGVVPPQAAAKSKAEIKCSTVIAKAGLARVRRLLKLAQRCRDAELVTPGSCPAIAPAALAKLDAAVAGTLQTGCGIGASGLANLGFPGPCTDANAGDGFTIYDLIDCIRTSHNDIVGSMLGLEYDAGLTMLAKPELTCQQEVAKQSSGFVACLLKSVQKCRAAIAKGKLPGVPAHLCATDDAKTAATIAKCRAKAGDGIRNKCSDGQIAGLAVCTPDQSTVTDAVDCLITQLTVLTDGPAIDVPADLVDYEYAVRGGLCGDGVVNNLNEECDGSDDAACPGACGTATDPNGYFACLCTTKRRLRVVEHASADTDNGWTGNSADTGVADGGGYLADLYDCDGFGLCNLGPSCSLAPHSSCQVLRSAPSGTTGDSICVGLGQGVCRKERTAVGPHCFQDIQKKCDFDQPNDPVCDVPGDFCAVTLVAPPNPVSSGGVSVCNVTVFSEDVVGTVNVLTGESIVRAPQHARTYAREVGSANKPCPICGGFCAVNKERCASTADCASGKGPCVTVKVCSEGPNAGKTCRAGAPFGNVSSFFGTTSVDCPPATGGEITSDAGLDLYVTNRTTGTVTLLPTESCANPGFTGNVCLGGTNEGRPCVDPSECPGGGSCAPQCFCPGQSRPNACNAACVGGLNDAAECVNDSECPSGFCHAADCRVDGDDHDSAQEGICTSGPGQGWCSTTTYRPCGVNSQCEPPACPYCSAGETCIPRKRACFVNSGIVRQGTPRTPEGTSVGIYCIEGDNDAVNTVAGFPGPAAFTQPELQLTVP